MKAVPAPNTLDHIREGFTGLLRFNGFSTGFLSDEEDIGGRKIGVLIDPAGYAAIRTLCLTDNNAVQHGILLVQRFDDRLVGTSVIQPFVVAHHQHSPTPGVTGGRADMPCRSNEGFIDVGSRPQGFIIDSRAQCVGNFGDVVRPGQMYSLIACKDHDGHPIASTEESQRLPGNTGHFLNVLARAAANIQQDHQRQRFCLASKVNDRLPRTFIENREIFFAYVGNQLPILSDLDVYANVGDP